MDPAANDQAHAHRDPAAVGVIHALLAELAQEEEELAGLRLPVSDQLRPAAAVGVVVDAQRHAQQARAGGIEVDGSGDAQGQGLADHPARGIHEAREAHPHAEELQAAGIQVAGHLAHDIHEDGRDLLAVRGKGRGTGIEDSPVEIDGGCRVSLRLDLQPQHASEVLPHRQVDGLPSPALAGFPLGGLVDDPSADQLRDDLGHG